MCPRWAERDRGVGLVWKKRGVVSRQVGRDGMRLEGRWEVSGNERERERERKRDSSYLNGDMSMEMEE